jgi:WD40 repeat protein
MCVVGWTTPKIWDVTTQTDQGSLSPVPVGNGASCAFNKAGTHLAISSSTDKLRVYNVSTWTELSGGGYNPNQPTVNFYGMDYDPDDGEIACVGYNGQVLILDGTTYEINHTPIACPDHCQGVEYSPDGAYLAVAHQDSPFFTVYNTATWAKLSNPSVLPEWTGRDVSWSPDGAYLAVAHEQKFSGGTKGLIVYDTSDWSVVLNWGNGDGYPGAGTTNCSFSKDGNYLYVCDDDNGPNVEVVRFNTSTWTKDSDPFDAHPSFSTNHIGIGPSDKYIAVGGNTDTRLHVWDVNLNTIAGYSFGNNVYDIAFTYG